MSGNAILPLACLMSVAGIAILRVSWSRPQRSAALNTLGWTGLAAGAIAGWAAAGAWGATVAALWAMGAAFIALTHATWRSPPARRAASNRGAGMLPESGEPLGLGQRIGTFAIVIVAGMVAAIALAVASRWIALLAGANEANANVIALFAAPVGWAALAFLLLMTTSRKRQFIMLAVALASALPAVLTGGMA